MYWFSQKTRQALGFMVISGIRTYSSPGELPGRPHEKLPPGASSTEEFHSNNSWPGSEEHRPGVTQWTKISLFTSPGKQDNQHLSPKIHRKVKALLSFFTCPSHTSLPFLAPLISLQTIPKPGSQVAKCPHHFAQEIHSGQLQGHCRDPGRGRYS